MDLRDYRILEFLSANCRTSYAKIARELSLSVVAVRKRVGNLHKKNMISIVLDMNPNIIGFIPIKVILTPTQEDTILKIDSDLSEVVLSEFWIHSDSHCQINGFARNATNINDIRKNIIRISNLDECKVYRLAYPKQSQCKYHEKTTKIMEHLATNPRVSSREVSNATGIKPRTVQRTIDRLQDDRNLNFTIRVHPDSAGLVGLSIQFRVRNLRTFCREFDSILSLFRNRLPHSSEFTRRHKLLFGHFMCESFNNALHFIDNVRNLDGAEIVSSSIIMKYRFLRSSSSFVVEKL